jgi:release factor glutamine methyltransferase
MKVECGSWLRRASNQLKKANIDSAQLDSLLLLENILKQDRTYLLAHPEQPLTQWQLIRLNQQLKLRLKHCPIAYILGHCEFYGRQFKVNRQVLIPRPESEAFIDLLKCLDKKCVQKLLDVGTGSGVLAITAQLELPNLGVWASDISAQALRVAAQNAKKLGVNNIYWLKTDLIDSRERKYDYILANLPYIPDNFDVSAAVAYEPNQALYSGSDGLHHIKRLIPSAYRSLNKQGYLLLESLPQQQVVVRQLCQDNGLRFIKNDGLVGCFQKP